MIIPLMSLLLRGHHILQPSVKHTSEYLGYTIHTKLSIQSLFVISLQLKEKSDAKKYNVFLEDKR